MPVRLRDLVHLVCVRLDVEPGELRDNRDQHVAEARACLYYLARRHTRLSWRAIVKRSTGQDHMAALRAYQRLVERVARDGAAQRLVEELEQRVGCM